MSDPFLSDAVANFLGPGGKSHGPWPRPATVPLPITQQLLRLEKLGQVTIICAQTFCKHHDDLRNGLRLPAW
eukprot:6591111-Alexandrium_andersonii.AAC.1